RNRSHRGLYVALGSCLTLLVLAAAAIGAPGFFGTRADSSGKKHTRPAHPAATEPAPSQAATSDDQTAAAPPSSPSTASSPSSSDASSSSSPTAAANQPSPSGQSDPVEPSTTGPHSASMKPAERAGTPSNGPSAQAQESYLAQMRELGEEVEQLDLRA